MNQAKNSFNSVNNTNHLLGESSPYLIQHLYNPVDWYPYNNEAFEKAKRENKLIFLSIGYSACHWCHVMAHESFENQRIAQILNENYISIKVDREEHPDVDNVYQTVVQILGRSGGWPLSVFLTPDGKPFFGGTYFPPTSRYGMIGFADLLLRLKGLYENQQQDVLSSAEEITSILKNVFRASKDKEKTPLNENTSQKILNSLYTKDETLKPSIFIPILKELNDEFDNKNGGFGQAPKFPNFPVLLFIIRELAENTEILQEASNNPKITAELRQSIIENVKHTLDEMGNGGIYDHIGGGFHRYSVDAQWAVPHFEKMLYDNALALVTYAEAAQFFHSLRYKEIVEEIFMWLQREMLDPIGGFYSTLDADSNGKEGEYYVWNSKQIHQNLESSEADLFIEAYGLTEQGNFEHGFSTLHRKVSNEVLARQLVQTPTEIKSRLNKAKEILLQHRSQRVYPHRDDKILTDWNALLVHGLFSAAKLWVKTEFGNKIREMAQKTLQFVKEKMYDPKERVLYHVFINNQRKIPGLLDDYAYLIQAELDAYEDSYNPEILVFIKTLFDDVSKYFWDESDQIYYFNNAEISRLPVRTINYMDMPLPNAMAVMIENLLQYYFYTNEESYRDRAEILITKLLSEIHRSPQAHASLLLAYQWWFYGSTDLAIVHPLSSTDSKKRILQDNLEKTYIPRLHYYEGEIMPKELPPFRLKESINNKITYYLCVRMHCFPPIGEKNEFEKLLSQIFDK